MGDKKKKQWKDLKPIEKLIAYGIGAFIIVAIIAGLSGAFDETEEEKEEREERQEQREQASAEKKKAKEEEKEKKEAEKEKEVSAENKEETETKSEEKDTSDGDDITWDDLKDKDKIVGKSDKDFKELTKSKPSDVRNDVTGNWRVVTMSESVDVTEYALSYQDLHMKEDEVHFIVNFNYNTTTWLNYMGGLLYVETRERVDKEEHDANKLGTGMTLKNYRIYPDGDIEELEE